MRKYFIRYFLYILTLALLLIMVQSAFFLFAYKSGRDAWRQDIYESCLKELEYNLRNSHFPDLKIDGLHLFESISKDNRISGYLVRDAEGAVNLTVGQTPGGRVLASFLRDDQKIKDGITVKTKRKSTVLNATFNMEKGTFEIHRKRTVTQKNKTFLPIDINANDIIGSVTVSYMDSPLLTIDILTYSPRTYVYSKQLVNSLFKRIFVSLPVCALIALCGAWIVSSRNARYIDSVRLALKKLSEGKTDVEIEEFKHSELGEITSAIHELDKNLLANKKSRNAWLNSISHDLNTPATAMKMIIDGFADGIFKPDSETLLQLQAENDTLNRRISRVIEYSTLISDTTPVFSVENSEDFADSVCSGFENIETEIKIDTIKCDRNLMKKAISELISNAKNCCSTDKIRLVIDGDENTYCIKVENKGNLPNSEDTDSLLEPWVRGDSARSQGGNGLGLPIVSAILSLHNGHVNILQKEDTVSVSVHWQGTCK